MTFSEFVAIRLNQTSKRTLDYKSISSFLSSVKENDELCLEDSLKVWVCDMIDCGVAVTSRKRYVEKLRTLYKEYSNGDDIAVNPFDSIKELCALDAPVNARRLQSELTKIEGIFDTIMTDAKSKPELAVFLYLLFNTSPDIEKVISLTMEEYIPEFRQLDEIIRWEEFHHRRKYIFDLNQSRKRIPQIVREVTNTLDFYFRVRNIKFPEGFTNKTILSLWMAKARMCGVKYADLKRIVDVIPAEYEYFRLLKSSILTADEIMSIKHRVAESFAPSGKRWYAIKLRRGIAYDILADYLKTNFAEYYDDRLLFYPQQEVARRVEKRIVTTVTPIIPDIVFIYINPRYIRKVDTLIKPERLGYVFRITSGADSGYSVIDTRSMTGFQNMIGIFTPDIKVELTEESPVGLGREVLITGGIMSGYEGTIFDIKEGSDIRQIYIRLSDKYSIKAEVKVEACFVKAIG
ncbi:hypothetical protein EZ315_00600 [Duncaniella freteri]|uniref:Uncharacterized protein n=2 Tax=Duncaniella TaxID=2518495 RepID=A0A4Z0V4Z2_9BACT|nr:MULTISPECIES: hypothetical protein [Bacteroidales]TGG39284.1 hypothetical protein EZ315_00600 [Duncaniella freteri]